MQEDDAPLHAAVSSLASSVTSSPTHLQDDLGVSPIASWFTPTNPHDASFPPEVNVDGKDAYTEDATSTAVYVGERCLPAMKAGSTFR